MSQSITFEEAARSFCDLIDKVYYNWEAFDVVIGTQILAHIGPAKPSTTLKVEDLNHFFASCPILSDDDFENDIKDIICQFVW